ncbi:hypothetical protein K490DRAFT_67048 [Saccharata proteae CBS 121410]|uniref:Dystroglycan-type cadherin-like domain-containing protein n=1 Tax=Saccharata proteae CBS 121410 TaxID=1314787 RepID=A0A9P4HQN6_9PEZI|nr:hypothetical protein K490DRAFT_67048 [Saccharata proteae CBS 121410]
MLRAAIYSMLAVAASAIPDVSFPFNSQVPPVARVSQSYNFQFSATTFAQSSGSLQYTLSGAPSWLALDGSNRRLWGTPGQADVGSATFNISAADSSGSVDTQGTIIVTSDPAPAIASNITEALSQAGKLSDSTSLSLYPATSFNIGFPRDTFRSSSNLTHYATLSDHTPLPAWLAFDADALSFSGVTPQLTASPQYFEILFIASDFAGFSGAWVTFTIVVSDHQLVFTSCEQNVSFTEGTTMTFSSLRSQLILDGAPISDQDFQNATASTPSWLSFDPTSLVITGDWPNDTSAASVSITAMDRFGDVANTTIQFISATPSPLFHTQIGTIDAVIGDNVTIDLSSMIDQQAGLNVTVDLGTAAQWLSFDRSTLTIRGRIPSSAPAQVIQGTVTVSNADGSETDSQQFTIQLTDNGSSMPSGTTSTSTSALSTSATSSATSAGSGSSNGARKASSRNTPIIIAIAVICVVLAVILAIIAYFFFKRRRRSTRRAGNQSPKVTKADVSRPIYQEEEWHDKEGAMERDMERGELTRMRTPEPPPVIPVPSPLKPAALTKKVRHSIGSSIGEGEEAVLKSFNRSSDWSFTDTSPNSHTPHQSMRVATEMARSTRIAEESPTRGRRRMRSSKHDSRVAKRYSMGVPASRRFTGAGHGRTSYGSSPRQGSRLLSRDSSSFSSYTTLSTAMLSPVASVYPVPPPSPDNASRFSDAEKRKSVRIVPGSLDELPLPDLRPMDQKRASYIRNRASNRSPFFSARASSRASSAHGPSIIGTLTESGASIEDVESGSGSGSGSGATAGENSKQVQKFPGSLRRKRTGANTARAYSAAPLGKTNTPTFLHRWDSQLRQRLALEGLPQRSNTGDSIRSSVPTASIYSEPDLSAFTISPSEKDAEEADKDASSGGASFPSPVPAALQIPKRNPRREVRKPSRNDSRRSSTETATQHKRTPSDRLDRDSQGNIIEFAGEGETPTIEEMNVAIAVRNSGTVSQGRRSRLSTAVRQQLQAQEQGSSVLHRGRRTPLSMISNASANAGAGAGQGGGLRVVEGSPRLVESKGSPRLVEGKGKRPISVEGGRWTSLRGKREETPGNEAFL